MMLWPSSGKHHDLANMKYVIADCLAVDKFDVPPYETLIIAAQDFWASKVAPNLKIALVPTTGVVPRGEGLYTVTWQGFGAWVSADKL